MKEVPHSLLKALGFRKAIKHTTGFSDKTWYHPVLELYYDPKQHDERKFARNLIHLVIQYRLPGEGMDRARKILDIDNDGW